LVDAYYDGTDERKDGAGLSRRFAPPAVAAALCFVYVLTLAPGVTYWDSGEFLAAMKTLGIPHPPGTPLYILVGNVWAGILSPLFGFAYAVNLLSAVTTAVACGVFTHLMLSWTGDRWASIAGGILAGLMSSVWLNANESEVYAPALLVSSLLMLVADNARRTGEGRWIVLLGYLCGLAWSLQLSALVAAPAALVLLLSRRGAGKKWILDTVPGAIVVSLIGASAVLFMLVRAQHDPGVNQGNPATWSAFMDVLTRAQYQPVSMFPRQAPLFIQVGNLFEYADWQVALSLAPDAPPSWRRTPITIAYAAFGAIGFIWHRRIDRTSWRAMTVLLIASTLVVILYLNMKASPSFGHGFLPPDAKHEARERDYFFALAFVCWGLWAGAGIVRIFSGMKSQSRIAAAALVIAPLVLNFSAVNRAARPIATAARDSAMKILATAPLRAVVFAYGDNDTYPVWYAQYVAGVRTDVTPVTIPLLGAKWYRAELARRHRLLPSDAVAKWQGAAQAMTAICASADTLGRPIVAARVRDRPPIPESCTARLR